MVLHHHVTSYCLSSQVRESIMATLAAVQLEDLPMVVKFILHSVSASDAYEVRAPNHVCSILHLNITYLNTTFYTTCFMVLVL